VIHAPRPDELSALQRLGCPFHQADCRTTIGRQTRYFHFPTEESLRSFMSRCNVEDMAEFDHSLRAWSRGSNYANVTDEQYQKLKK
jgi:hypothetical protein